MRSPMFIKIGQNSNVSPAYGVVTLSWWGSLSVSTTPRAMSARVLYSWVETRQRVTPRYSRLKVARRANDPTT